jgi:flagellar motility protein MotE (MotC chaperone)
MEHYSDDNESDESDDDNSAPQSHSNSQQSWLPREPLLKHWKLDVPFRVQCKKKHKEKLKVLTEALVYVEKVIKSKRTQFAGGRQGLQSHRAQAMASHLQLITKSGRPFAAAAEMAAESNRFAAKWGGQQLCGWTHH